jgi:hypothetical protein
MSILKVDTINEKTSGNGVQIAGHVVQVVQGQTSTQASTSSTSYTDTGLSASITPTSSSNKVLVVVTHNDNRVPSTTPAIGVQLLRDSTEIQEVCKYHGFNAGGNAHLTISATKLDSPSTTSAVTYKTRFKRTQGSDTVYMQVDNTPATITLMEIAQ